MLKVSKDLLLPYVDTNNTRIGFHVPPFTSVSHLHMHAITMPFKNKVRWLKYSEPWLWNRWYIGAERIITSLERRRDVQSMHNDESSDLWTWKWV